MKRDVINIEPQIVQIVSLNRERQLLARRYLFGFKDHDSFLYIPCITSCPFSKGSRNRSFTKPLLLSPNCQ